jgi:fibronectin-binding autotransporter adhesin
MKKQEIKNAIVDIYTKITTIRPCSLLRKPFFTGRFSYSIINFKEVCMSNKRYFLVAVVSVVIFASAQCIWAFDGYWSANALNPGDWSDVNNWDYTTVADGDGSSAWYQSDIPTGVVITTNVDALRAGQLIGNIYFVDMSPSTPGSYLIQGATTLNLQNTGTDTTSTISVNPVFDGGGIEQLAAEISAPISVVDGTNLSIIGSGGGTIKLSGNTTVVNGLATIGNTATVNLTGNLTLNNGDTTTDSGAVVNVTGILSTQTTAALGHTAIGGGSTVNLSGSGQLLGAANANIGNGSNGTLNVGLVPGDSATATFNTGITLGGGTSPATGTLNVRGGSTLNAGSGTTVSTIGDWGVGTGVMNLYDTAKVYTGELRLGQWNTSSGAVTLNDGSQLHSSSIWLGYASDAHVAAASGTLTTNNTSTVTTTGDLTVGANGNGDLVINDSSSVTVGGTLYSSRWGYYGADPSIGNTGTVTIGGTNRIALSAGAIDLGSNWTSTPCISIFDINDSAKVTTTGDFIVSHGAMGKATLTLNTSAKLTVGGQLIIHQDNGVNAYVNVKDTSNITAGSISMTPSSWGGDSQLNLSTSGTVSTGNLTSGFVTTGWIPGTNINVIDSSSLQATGNVALYQTTVVVAGSGKMSVTGNVILGVPNANWTSVDVSGTTNGLTIGGDLTFNRGEIKTSAVNNLVVPGGVDLTGTLYLNGGQITPTVSSATFMQGLAGAKVGQYGGQFMTWNGAATTDVTIAQALQHDSAAPSVDGGILAIGNGSVTLTGALTYTGTTKIDGITRLQINTPGSTVLAAITDNAAAGTGILGVGDGVTATNLSATSVRLDTVTVGAGSTLTIAAIPGGPFAGGGLTVVPEPSTIAMLALAALGLMVAAWRRRK